MPDGVSGILTTSGIGVITDAHGYVLRTVQNANESHPELVRVQGLSVKKTIIGQKLIANQQKQLDAVTEVLLQLTVMGGLDQIAVLDVSSLDRIRMQTMDGMEIVLGGSSLLHDRPHGAFGNGQNGRHTDADGRGESGLCAADGVIQSSSAPQNMKIG